MSRESLRDAAWPKAAVAFPYGAVLTIALGHWMHDTFSAFLAPLLPWLRPRLGLSLAAAGSLTLFLQLPSLLNPLLGAAADRWRWRWPVALAPALTATWMTLLGWPRDYFSLAALLLVAGLSVALFHAVGPALVARLAPNATGRGMGLFMAAGELGRMTGPLLAVAAVGWWGLEGLPRLALLGWLMTAVLWWRLRRDAAPAPEPRALWWREARRLLPAVPALVLLIVGRAALVGSLGVYLPTFLTGHGLSETQAGLWFALYEGAGVAGAFTLGALSDRIGRRRALVGFQTLGAALALAWVWLDRGRPSGVVLLGFVLLAVQPVMLALVQDEFPTMRATANGLYLALSFALRPPMVTALGALGDRWGLDWAFTVAALLAVVTLVGLRLFPPRQEVTA